MPPDPRIRRTISPSALVHHNQGFLRSLRRKRPETRGTYERALREFLRWTRRRGKFAFTPREVERYKRHLTRRLSPVSVSTYLTALRRLCEYLVRCGLIADNPARGVGGNSRPRSHSREALLPADVDALLAAIVAPDERGKRDFAFVKLMLGCALSEIEIVRADVADLASIEGAMYLRVQGKGRLRKDQSVRFPDDVRRSVENYLALRGNLSARDPLFTSAGNRTRGKRMTTRGVRDRVTLYLEQSGVKKGKDRRVTPYSLRHTAARMMAGSGATADEIRVRMRLGSVTTAQLYMKSDAGPSGE